MADVARAGLQALPAALLDGAGHDRQQLTDRPVHAGGLGRQPRLRAGREHDPYPGARGRPVEPGHSLGVGLHAVVGHQQRAQALAHVDRALQVGLADALVAADQVALGEPGAQLRRAR